jgi:hypothetical protein
MRRKAFVIAISIAGCFSDLPVLAADEVISRVPIEGTDYCRLQFPTIREDTLFTSRPQFKDPKDGDVIVFYGPCDYDPLGIDEIRRQRAEARRERRNDNQ